MRRREENKAWYHPKVLDMLGPEAGMCMWYGHRHHGGSACPGHEKVWQASRASVTKAALQRGEGETGSQDIEREID